MNGYLTLRDIYLYSGRTAGVICIIAACTCFGFLYGRILKQRIQELRALRDLLQLMEGEMEYQGPILPEAMLHCGMKVKGVCGEWFVNTGRRMLQLDGIGFSALWEEQIKELNEQSVLPGVCIEELHALGTKLSEPDKQTQVRAIHLTLLRLRELEEQQTKRLPGQIRLLATLSVLAGAMIIIILI